MTRTEQELLGSDTTISRYEVQNKKIIIFLAAVAAEEVVHLKKTPNFLTLTQIGTYRVLIMRLVKRTFNLVDHIFHSLTNISWDGHRLIRLLSKAPFSARGCHV